MSEMRLASLTIVNFQYWDYLHVDLTSPEGRTYQSVAIFGEQGSGKSTIARALRWLAYGNLGLGAEQTFPSSWNGRGLEDQLVRARFTRESSAGLRQDITLERRRPSGEHQHRVMIQVSGAGEGRFEGQDAAEMWPSFVGQAPKAHEGALWVVRRDEMEKIHKSLSDAEGKGYLLQFFNQAEFLSRMDDVIGELGDHLTQLLTAAGQHDTLTDQFTRLRKLSEEKKEEIRSLEREADDLNALIQRSALSPDEKSRLGDQVKIKTLQAEEASYKKELTEAELGRADLDRVVNAVLCASLLDAGFADAIPKVTLADEHDWDSILVKIQDLISSESAQALKKLAAQKRGLDLSPLRRIMPGLPDVLQQVQELKDARSNLLRIQAQLKAFDQHDITSDALRKLELRDEVYREAVDKSGSVAVMIEQEKEELVELEVRYEEKAEELAAAAEAQQGLKQAGKALSMAKGLKRALEAAESDYRTDMFNAALAKLTDFWSKTTTSDVFMPALSENGREIILKKVDTDEEFKILLEDQGQGPSSGESEQLLVCMAMALADQARVQMPLILDDVHTRMDNKTRPGVFRIARDSFDQIMFVTNDENKLLELKPYIEAVVKLKKARLGEVPHSTETYPHLLQVTDD
jgi:energy-coupling factor transporter ATP-binding protein EcfA2